MPDETNETADATPAPTPAPSGPWSDDLSSTFEDEGLRTQVDAFLREKVQPYVTQLETKSKASPEQELANQLYTDLQEDPSSTYLSITEELFGEELATAVQEALAGSVEKDDNGSPEYDPAADEQVDPRLQAIFDREEEREAREAYDSAIAQIKEKDPELDEQLFAPFVVSAEGNMDAAYTGYKQWYDSAQSRFAPAEETEEEQAPNILGADGQSGTVPPVTKRDMSFEDAARELMADMRPGAPTVVGGV